MTERDSERFQLSELTDQVLELSREIFTSSQEKRGKRINLYFSLEEEGKLRNVMDKYGKKNWLQSLKNLSLSVQYKSRRLVLPEEASVWFTLGRYDGSSVRADLKCRKYGKPQITVRDVSTFSTPGGGWGPSTWYGTIYSGPQEATSEEIQIFKNALELASSQQKLNKTKPENISFIRKVIGSDQYFEGAGHN